MRLEDAQKILKRPYVTERTFDQIERENKLCFLVDDRVSKTQIANAVQPLVDHPMRFLGGEGPAKRGDELIGLWLGPLEPQSAVGRSRIGPDTDLMGGHQSGRADTPGSVIRSA